MAPARDTEPVSTVGIVEREETRLFSLTTCVPPLQTSKCCEEMKEYIQAGVEEDVLVKGIAEDKNPFKDLKGGCVIC